MVTGQVMEVDIMVSERTYMRRGQVLEMLGITRYQLDCLIHSKTIKPILLAGMKQKIFKTTEIKKLQQI